MYIETLCHLPPITKIKQVRRTRHAGHCWRSKDELISDVLLWTPTYGQAKARGPARTYIQQVCEDTGCNPEDLPEAMNNREKWRERVRDIRASGTTWWWWWWSWATLHQNFLKTPSITMYIKTPYITIYIETAYITMYIETPSIIRYIKAPHITTYIETPSIMMHIIIIISRW